MVAEALSSESSHLTRALINGDIISLTRANYLGCSLRAAARNRRQHTQTGDVAQQREQNEGLRLGQSRIRVQRPGG